MLTSRVTEMEDYQHLGFRESSSETRLAVECFIPNYSSCFHIRVNFSWFKQVGVYNHESFATC